MKPEGLAERGERRGKKIRDGWPQKDARRDAKSDGAGMILSWSKRGKAGEVWGISEVSEYSILPQRSGEAEGAENEF